MTINETNRTQEINRTMTTNAMWQMYTKFNELYFGNECPKNCKLSLKRSSLTAYGKAKYHAKNLINPYEIVMYLNMSMSLQEFENVFVHEMIHIFWYHKGEIKHGHGPLFHQKMNEINARGMHKITVKEKNHPTNSVSSLAAKKFVLTSINPAKKRVIFLKSSLHNFNTLLEKLGYTQPKRILTNLTAKYKMSGKNLHQYLLQESEYEDVCRLLNS